LPVKKILITREFAAVRHPVPSYPDHILIVPRKIARNVFCLNGSDIRGAIETAKKIVKNRGRYILLINGGDRQDVMQAHFHLFNAGEPAGDQLKTAPELYGENFAARLRDFLIESNISEESFSLAFVLDDAGDGFFIK